MKDKQIAAELERAIDNYAADVRKRKLSDLDLADRYGRARTAYYEAVTRGKEVLDTYIIKKGYEVVCAERGVKIK